MLKYSFCRICNHSAAFCLPKKIPSPQSFSPIRQISFSAKKYDQESAEKPSTSAEAPKNDSRTEPKLWEDPYRYAYGPVRPQPRFTEVEESSDPEEWKWVERLLPKSLIPDVPEHESYPTPSGWFPPRYPPPDLPYYVRRDKNHMWGLFLEVRRDQLDPKTMEFDYAELVIMRGVEGDVFACEKDLKEYLERKLNKKVATHVNEAQGKIRVKGADRTLLEHFLGEKGF